MYFDDENKQIKILFADDDKNIRKLLVEILSRQNYIVEEAISGEMAIEMLRDHDYDLVISDLHMPNMGGMDVLKAAKEKDENLQVLILTGHGTIQTAVKAMKEGAYEYLAKPINTESLLLKVKNGLERKRLSQMLLEQQNKLYRYHQMIERDLSLAKQVQNSLVPKTFENSGITVAVEYLPMIGLGGDFADIYDDQQGHIYLSIIDVTGHGISAALMVNRVCSELRKFMRDGLQPREIIYNLNAFYCQSFSQTGMFLTVMSLKIDLNNKMLYYSGSAHPAGLIYRQNGRKFIRFDSQNQIIGFQDSNMDTFEEGEESIQSNDRIIIYTDGIVETESKNEVPFGLNGLKKSLEKYNSHDAEQAAHEIVNDVHQYAKIELRDDIMLMIADIK